MITAAAVCPQTPLLVPDVAQGAADDLDAVRAATFAALHAVIATAPDVMIVVAADAPSGRWDASSGGSFRSYGVEVRAGGRTDELPPRLTLGAWLLDAAGWTGPRTYLTADRDLDATATPVGLVVLADGSAKRSTSAPGYLDERAARFDATIATALRSADHDTLLTLDASLAAELWADVTALTNLARWMSGGDIAATVRYDAAPLGVGYWVADWRVL